MFTISRNLMEKSLRKRTKDFYLLTLILIYASVSSVIFILLNRLQLTPLIDEIFHIPQGITYIKGNFSEWNPKITTLPGLYLLSSAAFNVIAFVLNIPVESLCQVYYLRLFNFVISVFILNEIYSVLTFDDFSSKKVLDYRTAFWVTLNISIFPISYFFHNFYYTDTLSTLLVLMMYRQNLLNNFGKAALLGFCAIMVRQTNVIWVGYLMINELFHLCQKILRKRSAWDRYLIHNPVLAFRKLLEKKLLKPYLSHFYRNCRYYFLICIMFTVFVFFNNGIVVGDKDAHVPVLHLCQIFYYSFFMLIFGFPHFIPFIKEFLNATLENKKITFMSLILCWFVIHFNTMVHPYLLADNRHYVFYFWKRIFEKHYLMKYLLAPVYLFGIYAINKNLDVYKTSQFWICICLCLVPQKLLELRYFIIPYLIMRLEISYNSTWCTIIESFWFALINSLTIYIFVTKEFFWADTSAIQRIIW